MSPQKVDAVPYERWSFTRGSNYRALTGESLVFWIGGRVWEVVAYERWSFTRGSNYRALTGKILVFWIGGRLWEVVAYERLSLMEVRL